MTCILLSLVASSDKSILRRQGPKPMVYPDTTTSQLMFDQLEDEIRDLTGCQNLNP